MKRKLKKKEHNTPLLSFEKLTTITMFHINRYIVSALSVIISRWNEVFEQYKNREIHPLNTYKYKTMFSIWKFREGTCWVCRSHRLLFYDDRLYHFEMYTLNWRIYTKVTWNRNYIAKRWRFICANIKLRKYFMLFFLYFNGRWKTFLKIKIYSTIHH